MYLNKIEKETIYAVFADYSYMTYATLEDAIIANPIYIIKEFTGSWLNEKYYNFGLFHIVHNEKGDEIQIHAGNWKATNISYLASGTSGWYGKDKPVFQIIAPDGQIRDEDGGIKKTGIDGIIQTILFIEELSPYVNWSHYEVKVENLALKEKIKLLETEIEALKGK